MSLLKQAYATPSRVQGIYRLLLQAEGQRLGREELEKILAPSSLKSEDDEPDTKKVHYVVNEMIKIGLLVKREKEVLINDQLPKPLRHKDKGLEYLPVGLVDLMFKADDPENHDLGQLLSWFLAQDVLRAPGDFEEMEQTLRNQVGSGIEYNDVKYHQFFYWGRYLGFLWKYDMGVSKLVPDPTKYLRLLLPEIFKDEKTMRMQDVVRTLAQRCPVLEEGAIRTELDRQLGFEKLKDKYLSSATSHAWRLMEDEGIVELELKSDAGVYVLVEGERQQRVSHITWLGRKGHRG